MVGDSTGANKRRKISLRIKTILVLLVTAVTLIVLMYGMSYTVTLDSYKDLEKKETITNLNRMNALFTERLAALHTKSSDWASRGDTYQYMIDHNEEFVSSNLNISTFVNLGINIMLFIDKSGEIQYFQLVDLQSKTTQPIEQSYIQLILSSLKDHKISLVDSFSGVFSFQGLAAMLSCDPITNPKTLGQINGLLLFGRVLEEQFINSLSESASMDINFKVLQDIKVPQVSEYELLPTGALYSIDYVNSHQMKGEVVVSDIYGDPALVFTVLLPRDIYQQGLHVVHTFFIWAVILILLAIGVSMLLLELLVVRRLTGLSQRVTQIGRNSVNERVPISGRDEISSLGNNINKMLDSLEESQLGLKKSNELLEQRVNERTSELKTQKELTDSILAAMPSGVVLIESTGRILHANEAFLHLFVNAPNPLGMQIIDVLGVEIPLLEISKSCVSINDVYSSEFRYSKNGSIRHIKVSFVSVQDKVLAIFEDITEERNRQERLYLTDRLASVGEMAAGVAHELNNPLTGVIGLSQLLVDEDVPDNVKEDLKKVHSEAKRAAAIVKNLLTFARKHASTKQPTRIDHVIDNVLQLRAYEHKVHNIKVGTQFDTELPEVMVDYSQMQQVFLNIILNAEQAMIEAHNKGTLTIIGEKVNGNVRISCTDDGPGISPENMRKLFTPFFTTKEVGKGTGLGLSICYGIVKDHGGRIYAESRCGKGATFVVELPINVTSQGEVYETG